MYNFVRTSKNRYILVGLYIYGLRPFKSVKSIIEWVDNRTWKNDFSIYSKEEWETYLIKLQVRELI